MVYSNALIKSIGKSHPQVRELDGNKFLAVVAALIVASDGSVLERIG